MDQKLSSWFIFFVILFEIVLHFHFFKKSRDGSRVFLLIWRFLHPSFRPIFLSDGSCFFSRTIEAPTLLRENARLRPITLREGSSDNLFLIFSINPVFAILCDFISMQNRKKMLVIIFLKSKWNLFAFAAELLVDLYFQSKALQIYNIFEQEIYKKGWNTARMEWELPILFPAVKVSWMVGGWV